MAEVVNLNMFGGETPQVSTMPTPSAELAGKILQYAGATDGNFTAGYFYKCVMVNGIPLWQRTNVQPSNAGISWGGVDGNIADQTDLANALNGKAGKTTVTFVVNTTEQLAIKTAAAGNTAIVKTTGKLHTYDGDVWDGGVNGEYGVIYVGENEQYVWDTTKFVLISTEDAKTLNGKSESYFAKEDEVAKKDGRYPLMNVGSADNLTGGNRVSREFTEDTSGGTDDIADGIVQIEKVKGNTIVWNQNYYKENGTITLYGISYSINDGIITASGTAITTSYLTYKFDYVVGHKYFINGCPDGGSSLTHEIVVGGQTSVRLRDSNGLIFTNKSGNYLNIQIAKDNSVNNLIFIPQIFDLTLMFGAGNEPSTVAEFKKMFPLDYYDYNEGEIISLNHTGIKTVGFNAYNHSTGKAYVIGGKQYQITGAYSSIAEGDAAVTPDSDGLFTPTKNGELTITGGDSTTTCVHLVWSGKRNGEYEEHWEETRDIDVASIMYQGSPLFPDGLCSVGNAYDEITPVKAVKRIGKRARVEGDEDDTSVITDGTNTLYVLDTPIEVTFAEPLNLNYRVSDFGTETLLPTNTATPVTTPIRMDVEYGLNVVDTVRNLSRNYLGMTGTQNTFAVIASALAAYGISMTLGDYDETNKYYPVTISGGWKPANAAPASATAAGSKGEYYIDAEYFYVCVDDATWKRFALSSW